LRKYIRFMAVILPLTGSFGALLTLHSYSTPGGE
jgi:multisubunit Na+/H+ antiporter MnhB subunit